MIWPEKVADDTIHSYGLIIDTGQPEAHVVVQLAAVGAEIGDCELVVDIGVESARSNVPMDNYLEPFIGRYGHIADNPILVVAAVEANEAGVVAGDVGTDNVQGFVHIGRQRRVRMLEVDLDPHVVETGGKAVAVSPAFAGGTAELDRLNAIYSGSVRNHGGSAYDLIRHDIADVLSGGPQGWLEVSDKGTGQRVDVVDQGLVAQFDLIAVGHEVIVRVGVVRQGVVNGDLIVIPEPVIIRVRIRIRRAVRSCISADETIVVDVI